MIQVPIIPPELRPYQVKAIEALRQAVRDGHKRIILNSPTGSGKTLTAAEIIRGAVAKNRKVAFLANRIHLVAQTARVLNGYGIECGIIQGANTKAPWSSVLVCSIQTVARRGLPDVDLMVIDECFTGETLVETSMGPRRIDLVRCGDTVYNQCGAGTVETVFARPANDIYHLRFEDGSEIECTGNHRFFTPFGWETARRLEVGTHLFSPEGVRLLREAVQTMGKNGRKRAHDFGLSRTDMEQANMLFNILQDEVQEPNEQPSSPIKNEGAATRNKTQANKTRRQWATAPFGPTSTTPRARGGLGIGISSQNPSESPYVWLSIVLQTGYCKSREKDRNRTRRGFTSFHGQEGPGSEKDGFPCFPRLVGISPVQRESPVTVYNLHISGHPSYFANGKLVHNCHGAAGTKGYHELMALGTPVLGLTATPYSVGLGKHYDSLGGPLFEKVVTAAKIMDLIRDGFLVSAEIWAPGEPDLSKVKIVAGDYDEKQLGEAVDKAELIGDIVSHWIKLANNESTVVFATNIAHSKHICEQFLSVGVKAEHLDCFTKDDDRIAILARVQSGETKIICNVGVLCEGWDFPACKVLILARPTKSLIRYLQMAGRVLRPYPGKAQAMILDHSGAVRRLGFPWDDFDQPLDDGKPKSSKAKKERTEPLPKPCPQCHFMKPPRTPICPMCNFEAKAHGEIETADGELVQITGKERKPKTLALSVLGKQTVYGQLLDHAQSHGYSAGWVAHKYKEVFGVWPRGLVDHAEPVSLEVANWIRHQTIKWAKGRAKEKAS